MCGITVIDIPKRIRDLKGYVAGKTIAEVREIYKPEQISKLASNENRLGCSPHVVPAVQEALSEIQDYPDPVSRELRDELARRNSIHVDEILVASGSESILSILCRALLDENSNIVTADATFVGIFVQAGVMGAKIKRVPVTKEYRYDTEAILDAIDENTKIVYIANPNNPTGTYVGKDEYSAFIKKIPDHITVIADEAYYEYAEGVMDYPPALNYRRENVIVTRTFSKGYGLAGFRIGYAIADPDMISQLLKCKLTFEPTTLAQAAALAALKDRKFLKQSLELVEQQRDALCDFFDEHGATYAPSISNSVMMVLDSVEAAEEFTQRMLEKGVILRRLNAFGLPDCVRITIGTAREMDHFKRSFKELK